MITKSVNIGPKGQVVLPKLVREVLRTNNIIFEIDDNQVIIRPLYKVAGALSHYKKNIEDFSKVREEALSEASHDHQK